MDAVPVALFVYNRPLHARETLDALARNDLARSTELFVFADGPREGCIGAPGPCDEGARLSATREVIARADGFSRVHVRASAVHRGLAASIMAGVTQVLASHGRVIVLEDDMVTSPDFLGWMNWGLRFHEATQTVCQIHAYSPAVAGLPESFFLRGADCWGWGTWSRAWQHMNTDAGNLLERLRAERLESEFDLDGAYPYVEMLRKQAEGLIDSWAIRWHASCFLAGLLTLHPGLTFVRNIGLDGSGTHCARDERLVVSSPRERRDLSGFLARQEQRVVHEDREARRLLAEHFRGPPSRPVSWRARLARFVPRLFGR